MKILTNRKIKRLFIRLLLAFLFFTLISVVCTLLQPEHSALYVLLSFTGAGLSAFALLYRYFREQDRILDEAAAQIRDFLSGDTDARLSCDEEGGLYRLFQEVNSLAAILNAHAENEKRAKLFLKDTISNISHQLKTPLAALNVYNGILQAETADAPELQEFANLSEQELDRIENLVQNLLKINPQMKFVVYTLELDILSSILRIFEKYHISRSEVIQISMSKLNRKNVFEAKPAPWIISGEITE